MSKKCHHHGSGLETVKCLVKVLETLLAEEGHKVEGCITLNQGVHEITVTTEVSPERVFLSVDAGDMSVCIGDINTVGYTIIPEGFILYADIKSAVAEISYFVEG